MSADTHFASGWTLGTWSFSGAWTLEFGALDCNGVHGNEVMPRASLTDRQVRPTEPGTNLANNFIFWLVLE
jgi:hypothetical protein